jgi:serine O-acetyltransferase
MSLLEILRADASRQHHFAGRRTDPARNAPLLRILLSPRFAPVLLFRLGAWCSGHHLRPIGKIFSLVNFVVFGIEIGLNCEIGPGLYFPHTSGTVLGAKRIGCNAVIYHNVTVGAKVPDLRYDADLRPEIGNDVMLGAGAKVLGPITLGDGVVVGANSVVLHSMPPGCLVVGVPGRAIERGPDLLPEPGRASGSLPGVGA